MPEITGISKTSFTPKDSTTPIEGTTFYISEPIDPKHGIGTKGDKFFLSRAKLAELTFTPAIGQEIEIFYNRYGKVCSLKLLNLDDIEID